jgi:glycerol kinase
VVVLAIDQGTSSTKALVVDDDGVTVIGRAEIAVHPHPVGHDGDDSGVGAGGAGGVEQDPEELWESVLAAGRGALDAAGRPPVAAIGLANQGETVLAWDRRTGRPLTPAIVWQDRRSAAVCDRLAAAGWGTRLREITGLELDPYFAAPKMAWVREHLTRDGVVTTTDTWLLHRLCGAFVTDAATASRTLLLDLDGVGWSIEACEAFGIDPATLPALVGCATAVGEASVFGGAPVCGLAVDQQAALFAERCHDAGEAKCTYGTGAFLLASTGSQPVRSGNGLVSCVGRSASRAPRRWRHRRRPTPRGASTVRCSLSAPP